MGFGLLQAIGINRGGRTSNLNAFTDDGGRPLRFLLTGGNAADAKAAHLLLDELNPRTILLADKAYDSDSIRALIEEHSGQGALAENPLGTRNER